MAANRHKKHVVKFHHGGHREDGEKYESQISANSHRGVPPLWVGGDTRPGLAKLGQN
jgi:hypothetical protein